MLNFNFHVPTKIYFGKNTIGYLDEIKNYGKKVLLVYGGGSIKKNGLYDEAMSILAKESIDVFELSGVEPNPRIQSVRRGVELCKINNIDETKAAHSFIYL